MNRLPIVALCCMTAYLFADASLGAQSPERVRPFSPGLSQAEDHKPEGGNMSSTGQASHKCLLERCYDLRTLAQQRGFVAVNVELDVPNLLDETRAAPEFQSVFAETRRRAIAQAQARLTKRMQPFNITVVSKYTFFPGIKIRANTKALEDLIENSEVKSIRPDN